MLFNGNRINIIKIYLIAEYKNNQISNPKMITSKQTIIIKRIVESIFT